MKLFLFLFLFFSVTTAQEFGVYEYVVKNAQGSLDDISQSISKSASESGWKVLASTDCGTPEDCNYSARVLVVLDSAYAQQIMEINKKTGPFSVTDRINIFQDEEGTHISVVNPNSVNRTFLMDDEKYGPMSDDHLQKLRSLITSAVSGEQSTKQYGPLRDEGYISRTMGVMAGGDFIEKIEDNWIMENADLHTIAEKVKTGLSTPGPEWGLTQVFMLDLKTHETIIFGITGQLMEAKSFDIVEEGDDDSRENFTCPGLAHAGAYPFQVVLTKEDDQVKISMVTSMYRMKIFFEDAGKWAFMKNMGMPGSLFSEVEESINNGLSK